MQYTLIYLKKKKENKNQSLSSLPAGGQEYKQGLSCKD